MSELELPMEAPEIRRLLPHRYPMLLIDRVIEIEPQKRIVALKNVTQNEPIFQGHFPDFPIFPGVLVVEAMAQAAGVLAIHHWGAGDGRLYVFAGIQKARFRRPVVPGDQLRLEVESLRFRASHSRFQGKALVGDDVAAEATFHTALAPS